MTVLVVYGSQYIGDQVNNFLQKLENLSIVRTTQSHHDALSYFVMYNPHIVILDAELNGGKGIEVLQHLKSFTTPCIVMMTAVSTYAQYRKECMKHGADYFFNIPDEMSEMGDTLQHLAAKANILEMINKQ